MTIRLVLGLILWGLVAGGSHAAELTFFGDFEDFGDGNFYTSDDPPDPGSFILLSESIVGIPKFDPNLGTLTDITIRIDEFNPIEFGIFGDIDVAQDDEQIDFFGDAELNGDFGVYVGSNSLTNVFSDFFDLLTGCSGGPFDGGCSSGDPADSPGAGLIFGDTSIFGVADVADFVGTGDVDALLVGAFLPIAAMFSGDNVSFSTLDVFVDVFAGDLGSGEDIIELTYTFTPVPLPASLLFFGPALGWLALSRRR